MTHKVQGTTTKLAYYADENFHQKQWKLESKVLKEDQANIPYLTNFFKNKDEIDISRET